jgi:uncharacterized membrane protein YgdD (TMEM256/DUF423 family)
MGAAGVLLGAFGAHALRATLEARATTGLWQTAVLYHLIHSVALLALAGWTATATGRAARAARAAAWCWCAGVFLFSGSLYLLALGASRRFGPVTPAGGILLVAGWVMAAVGSARGPAAPSS